MIFGYLNCRDFVFAVAISANVYALLSTTKLCRVTAFSGAGGGGNENAQNGKMMIQAHVRRIKDCPRNVADLPSYNEAVSSTAYTRPLFIRENEALAQEVSNSIS